MSDAPQRIIDSETGYRRDLREAELQIIAAGDDPIARSLAFQRHAEAIRNMMIAEMIPSFHKVLGPLLDDKLAPVVLQLTDTERTTTDWRNELRLTLDDRFGFFENDLRELKDGLARLQKS